MSDVTKSITCPADEWTVVDTGPSSINVHLRDLLGEIHIHVGPVIPNTKPDEGFKDYLTLKSGERTVLSSLSATHTIYAIPGLRITNPLTLETTPYAAAQSSGGSTLNAGYSRVYSNAGLTLTETATPEGGTPVYTRVITLTVANNPDSWSQIGRWTSSDGSALPAGLMTFDGQLLTLNGMSLTFNPA